MKTSIYLSEHKNLVSELKKARKEIKLSQKEVAECLTVTQSYISKIESGLVRIDVLLLKRLAQIYKKDYEHFIGK